MRHILLALALLSAPAAAQTILPPLPTTGIGCAYNSSPPTLATGSIGWVQCSATGALLVSGPVIVSNFPATQTVVDVSGATHASVVCQITVTSAATSLASLLATAYAASSTACPLSAVPAWATMAFVQVPAAGQQVNYSTGTPTAGATGVGTWIAPGVSWPVQGQATLQSISLISSTNVTVNVEFRG